MSETLAVTMTLPRPLIAMLDERAARETRSRSNLAVVLLRRALADDPEPVAEARASEKTSEERL